MKLKILFLLILLLSLSACQTTYEMELFEGQDTVEIHTEWEDMGAAIDMKTYWKLADNLDGEVDTSTLGTYSIIYYREYGGKMYSVTRYVQVVDQTAPVITLNPGLDSIQVGDEWEDAGATVYDNSLEELDITVTGNVNINIAGTYEIIYTAIDSSGNTTSVSRYVTVF